MATETTRIENKGQNANGENVYRIYRDGEHLDIGDVIKRTPSRWCAWPAVRGEARGRDSVTHHTTRKEAIARLVDNSHDANL